MLRLTLGLVRKSAVSGNSTGEERASREEVEPVVAGLCMGDASGLRLGDTPGWETRLLITTWCLKAHITLLADFWFQIHVES